MTVNFKAGDKVRRTGETHGQVKKGDVYTVEEVGATWVTLVGVNATYDRNKFELSFDLHKEKWFIRVGGMEHSKAVQEWLFDNGFEWVNSGKSIEAYHQTYIGNFEGDNRLYKTEDITNEKINGVNEIKVSVKTTVDTITYPEVESPQQIKIRELEETIAKAQEQIQELKKGL